jgi:hypothetical protein
VALGHGGGGVRVARAGTDTRLAGALNPVVQATQATPRDTG